MEIVVLRFDVDYDRRYVPVTFSLSFDPDNNSWRVFSGNAPDQTLIEVCDLKFKEAYYLFWTYYYTLPFTTELEFGYEIDDKTEKKIIKKIKKKYPNHPLGKKLQYNNLNVIF